LDPCLAQEALDVVVRRPVGAQLLDRDVATDRLVASEHDVAHAPASQQVAQLVIGQRQPWRRLQAYGWSVCRRLCITGYERVRAGELLVGARGVIARHAAI